MATVSEALATGLKYHQAGQLQRASELYHQVLQDAPQQADALHLLGVIAHQVGKHQEAVDYISRAIASNSRNASFHSNLGEAHRAMRNLDQAVASYRRALELQPDCVQAHNNLGIVLHGLGKLDQAIASFRQAVRIKPDYAEAHNNLGSALLQRGDLSEAAACCQCALKLKPDYAWAHLNLGKALHRQGKLEAAAANFQRALQIDPRLAEAHAGLALVPEDQRKSDQAAGDGTAPGVRSAAPPVCSAAASPPKGAGEISAVHRAYVRRFRQYQQIYMDYPRYVHIETHARCNARCTFCPHAQLRRKNQEMPDELFRNIISDLKQIPTELPFFVSPFKVNEMMLDRGIFDKVRFINAELPNAGLMIFSNFSLVDARAAEEIRRIRNLALVTVSLNSLDAEEYRQIMGLDLARTLANVKGFMDLNRQSRFTGPVVLSRIGDCTPGDARFVRQASEVFAGYVEGVDYQAALRRRGEWMGYVTSPTGKLDELPCAAWFELSITCTGEVSLCCMDGNCDYPIGDASRESLLNIYNGPWYRSLREFGLPRCQVAACANCSMLQ